ncbi:MAG: bifunctional phosphopantothenoylcysteine decarboxylase/phosphopantothenate--cysteine ligase CoaBC, partial [Paracoccaceae bacterium]|nr:bifunctional phosphopantothenoylcysteine decarboxylase/phosphopantothenate--cysteine ligase CoaBC [Paracoccaceae bacterium]
MAADKTLLLIIGGGIAAYKCLDLIRRAAERGYRVTPVMTKAAAEFVTPLSVSALAGTEVHQDLFDLTSETEMGHIQLSRSADLIVVAPATADLMAKMTGGHANDLASTLLMATDTPVLIAPAMNVRMWKHVATQRNLKQLRGDGVYVVGPNEGDMACGEFGPGRMAEPLEILDAVDGLLRKGRLSGRHILVTAGPTHEPIDPVRYIANRSSGKQGYAIAAALAAEGAQVSLISGPVTEPAPHGVDMIRVESAREMLTATEAALPADAAVFAAAVADWRTTT